MKIISIVSVIYLAFYSFFALACGSAVEEVYKANDQTGQQQAQEEQKEEDAAAKALREAYAALELVRDGLFLNDAHVTDDEMDEQLDKLDDRQKKGLLAIALNPEALNSYQDDEEKSELSDNENLIVKVGKATSAIVRRAQNASRINSIRRRSALVVRLVARGKFGQDSIPDQATNRQTADFLYDLKAFAHIRANSLFDANKQRCLNIASKADRYDTAETPQNFAENFKRLLLQDMLAYAVDVDAPYDFHHQMAVSLARDGVPFTKKMLESLQEPVWPDDLLNFNDRIEASQLGDFVKYLVVFSSEIEKEKQAESRDIVFRETTAPTNRVRMGQSIPRRFLGVMIEQFGQQVR